MHCVLPSRVIILIWVRKWAYSFTYILYFLVFDFNQIFLIDPLTLCLIVHSIFSNSLSGSHAFQVDMLITFSIHSYTRVHYQSRIVVYYYRLTLIAPYSRQILQKNIPLSLTWAPVVSLRNMPLWVKRIYYVVCIFLLCCSIYA